MTDGGAQEQDGFGVGDVFGDGGVFGILAAAADRIIPSDEWPSATGLGVIGYLERQRGTVHLAYWRDVLQPGLLALNREATARGGHSFDLLEVDEQDQLLSDVESGRV